MNREMVGNEGEKNLFVGVSQVQIPTSQLIGIHAVLSARYAGYSLCSPVFNRNASQFMPK
jgi:hypothetical protein